MPEFPPVMKGDEVRLACEVRKLVDGPILSGGRCSHCASRLSRDEGFEFRIWSVLEAGNLLGQPGPRRQMVVKVCRILRTVRLPVPTKRSPPSTAYMRMSTAVRSGNFCWAALSRFELCGGGRDWLRWIHCVAQSTGVLNIQSTVGRSCRTDLSAGDGHSGRGRQFDAPARGPAQTAFVRASCLVLCRGARRRLQSTFRVQWQISGTSSRVRIRYFSRQISLSRCLSVESEIACPRWASDFRFIARSPLRLLF